MRKLLALLTVVLTTVFGTSAFASEFTPFTTAAEAAKYCPAVTGLTFVPNTQLPNSQGLVTGFNRVQFQSITGKNTIRPKDFDKNGIIQNVEFRSADGIYGYISNDVITCLYTYHNFLETPYALAMRSGR